MMRTEKKVSGPALASFNSACTAAAGAGTGGRWQIGAPITTYWAGPGFPEKSLQPLALDDRAAKQIAEGGFNLMWSSEGQLDIAQRHGLRAILFLGPELDPQSRHPMNPHIMSDPVQITALDALIERVKHHPALYAYFITDEPNASLFPALGKLVAHLRERDPAHLAYINLNPPVTTVSFKTLGTKGDTITAGREYLRLFIEQVKPDILSYDYYHFFSDSTDGENYFVNLSMMRQAALDAGIPFMNIVQACTWDQGYRVPNGNEMRWLNYTSLAYGAQALLYYVYGPINGHTGGMQNRDGSTTAQYAAARELNPQFIAIASQLQPLRSLGAYHVGIIPWGATAWLGNAPFSLDFSGEGMSQLPAEGMLMGYFGKADNSTEDIALTHTHVLVVNLNYKSAVTTTVVGPGPLSLFDTVTREWTRPAGSRVAVTLPPGGGKLIRVER